MNGQNPTYWCLCGYIGDDFAGEACTACGADFPPPDEHGHTVACHNCGCGQYEEICPECGESSPFGLWDTGPIDIRDAIVKRRQEDRV